MNRLVTALALALLALALLALALLAAPAPSAQTVRYVLPSATGAADGTSWADAFPDLAPALAAAQPGMELWVAEGTYTPGAVRDTSFVLVSGVALYGGFAGTETARDQRDPEAHPTVLSGEIGDAGVVTDNSYHVLVGSGVDRTAVVDGFTVTAGYGDGPRPRNSGAGLYVIGGSPTVRNVLFTQNEVRFDGSLAGFGGAVFAGGGSAPLFEDVEFISNRAGGAQGVGGAVANRPDASPVFVRVRFEDNHATSLAGAMANETRSSPVLIDAVVRGNSARYTGGIDNFRDCDAAFWNVRFENNRAREYGGGMTNDTRSDARLYNVAFVGNVAQNETEAGAAGLQNNGSDPVLVGVTFAGNVAADGPGGMGNRAGGAPVVRNAIFWGNVGGELEGVTDLSHALVQGGHPGTAVLDADPRFVREPNKDDLGDLHLQPGSPAINAGLASALPADAADLDGDGDTAEALPLDLGRRPRQMGGGVDLGAYEAEGAVGLRAAPAPSGSRLLPPFPNPAAAGVTVGVLLADAAAPVLTVHDALGRTVSTHRLGAQAPGLHAFDLGTAHLAAGVYTLRLHTEAGAAVQPLTIVR